MSPNRKGKGLMTRQPDLIQWEQSRTCIFTNERHISAAIFPIRPCVQGVNIPSLSICGGFVLPAQLDCPHLSLTALFQGRATLLPYGCTISSCKSHFYKENSLYHTHRSCNHATCMGRQEFKQQRAKSTGKWSALRPILSMWTLQNRIMKTIPPL